MAVPIGLGAVLDHYLKWTPWGIVGGALFGLIAGLLHLIALSNRPKDSGSSKPGRSER
jgi:F0F1-type ATP synthase assembly protein I